jgi:hypothetical protein
VTDPAVSVEEAIELERRDRRELGCACLTLLIALPAVAIACLYAIVWIWRHA